MEIKVNAPVIVHEGRNILRIKSDVEIVHITGPESYRVKPTRGIWDTGATHTSIPLSTAQALGLTLGDEVMSMGVTAQGRSYPCEFQLNFPPLGAIRVREGLAVEGMKTPLLIGMDVIKQGRTTIEPDGDGGVKFTFTLSDEL